MKAILVHIDGDTVMTIPDTAVDRAPAGEVSKGRPLVAYLPDEATGYRVSVCMAVRVSGACKALDTRFALRYIDAIALALLVEPDRCLEGVMPGAIVHDGAVQLAPWTAIGEVAPDNIVVEALTGEKAPLPWSDVPRAMCLASRVMTLRTGDVLLLKVPCLTPTACQASPSVNRWTTVTASAGAMTIVKRFK